MNLGLFAICMTQFHRWKRPETSGQDNMAENRWTLFAIGILLLLTTVYGNCPTPPTIFGDRNVCMPKTGSVGDSKSCFAFYHYVNQHTWSAMKGECEAKGGRLVHPGANFNVADIVSSVSGKKAFEKIRLDLVYTRICEDRFYITGTNQTAGTCATLTNVTCSDTNSPTECTNLGCCFRAGQCLYPASQELVGYHPIQSVQGLNTAYPSSDTRRQCVQIVLLETSPYLEVYNCSEVGNDAVWYACEFKCIPGPWPEEKRTNTSWISPDQCPVTTTSTSTVSSQSTAALGSTIVANGNTMAQTTKRVSPTQRAPTSHGTPTQTEPTTGKGHGRSTAKSSIGRRPRHSGGSTAEGASMIMSACIIISYVILC